MNMTAMLKHAWQKHRERVRNVQAEVDHESPSLQVNSMLRPHQLKVDADFFSRMMTANNELLQYMNRLSRTQGVIDSFPQPKHVINPLHKRRVALKRIKELEVHNALMGKRILNQKPELNTFPPPVKTTVIRKPVKKETRPPFEIPALVLAKYDMTSLKMPEDIVWQQRFLRPRIYMDLAIKDLRSLGRLIFELYTEASPQIVLEFVRVCKLEKADNVKLLRVFPGLWLEGELFAEENSLTAKPLEYDMRALEHESGAGVLAYSSRFLKTGFRRGVINFSLSFKPLTVLGGQRVAFGRLVNGLKILDCMQDYGTKNGKLRRDLVVTNCGVLN